MRIVSAALCLILAIGLFFSCSKEKSFELAAPAKGSLQSDVTGDCLPKTAVGAYIAGTPLTDSNYLDVQVNVSAAGTYSIHTDTTNGYYFTGIGSFDHSGLNDIHLKAIGTPTVAKEDSFTVIFDTSFCFVNVTVLPEGSISGPAAFTLQGSGDSCLEYSVGGTYLQNTPLTANNTVSIRITATTPGTYNITTNSVNDFQFSGAGTIAAPGDQTIVLTGSGTPTTEGASVFTVTAGNTTCTFTINVAAGTGQPPMPIGDLFPLTNTSYWTYSNNGANVQDSFVVTSTGTSPQAGNTYNLFNITDGNGQTLDGAYYRKSGNDYYTYEAVDKFTSHAFDTPMDSDILFLKEGLALNDTWNSGEFSGTESGTPVKLQYVFTCTGVNGTATANNITYNNVTRIITKPQISQNGGAYALTGEQIESYYAAGIGLIYQKVSANGATASETFIMHYHVL